jgi:phage head maturation protease
MSFGFIIDNTEERDGYTTFKDEEGDYHTTITHISRVYDVSCVSIPASPFTEVSEMRCRSAAAAQIEADRKAAEEAEKAAEEEERQKQIEEEEQRLAEVARRKRRARALALNTI